MKLKQELKEWLLKSDIENPYSITLKLMTENPITASKHLKYFRRKYERAIGARYRRYHFIPVFEPDNGNPHYHIIADRPSYLDHKEYLDQIHRTIKQVKQIKRDYNDIKPIHSINGAFNYSIKKIEAEAELDWGNYKG